MGARRVGATSWVVAVSESVRSGRGRRPGAAVSRGSVGRRAFPPLGRTGSAWRATGGPGAPVPPGPSRGTLHVPTHHHPPPPPVQLHRHLYPESAPTIYSVCVESWTWRDRGRQSLSAPSSAGDVVGGRRPESARSGQGCRRGAAVSRGSGSAARFPRSAGRGEGRVAPRRAVRGRPSRPGPRRGTPWVPKPTTTAPAAACPTPSLYTKSALMIYSVGVESWM